MFGMDAEDVPAWREGKRHEWKDYDPRFVQALDMIMSGTFGDVEYFTVRTNIFSREPSHAGVEAFGRCACLLQITSLLHIAVVALGFRA